MNGYDIALTLHALLDKRLCPRYIVYRAVGLATTIKPSWEHQHMIVALETSLNHTRKVATVASCLVDTYANGSKTRQVHKQIVDKIAEMPIVMTTYYSTERHSILSSKRMIGHKSIKTPIVLGWQILLAHYLNIHLKIAHASLEPIHTRKVAAVPYKLVHLVLVNNALEP